jgi:arabinogalactan endo-1,4-beta-galactosidase
MNKYILWISALLLVVSCRQNLSRSPDEKLYEELEFGGDLSLVKRIEDLGGQFRINGEEKEGFRIFRECNYNWCRLRLFHTPDIRGPVVNNLKYTIESAQEAKKHGFKILLNFHYSDTWADPGKQFIPAAWEELGFSTLADSVYAYTKYVINSMDKAGVLPEMVQIGNEINNGMLWPHGRLWGENGQARWDELSGLIMAGIRGVKDSDNGSNIPIMIHAATGGDLVESDNFYSNIIKRDIDFEVIGLSYYPWWHGTFEELEKNLLFISAKYRQEISVVETAYYANGWYPEPAEWVLDVQPYPPTEQGQYDFMVDLAQRISKFPKVTSLYYWEPESYTVPGSEIPFLGRSLFDPNGNAYKGIYAWKPEE